MQLTALVGKTNEMYNLLLGELAQVHPITRALSGTPPSTRLVAGEIVALGILATLEARMGLERKGERACSFINEHEVHNQ